MLTLIATRTMDFRMPPFYWSQQRNGATSLWSCILMDAYSAQQGKIDIARQIGPRSVIPEARRQCHNDSEAT